MGSGPPHAARPIRPTSAVASAFVATSQMRRTLDARQVSASPMGGPDLAACVDIHWKGGGRGGCGGGLGGDGGGQLNERPSAWPAS